MKIECDESGDWLTIDGEKFGSSGDREFEILASRIVEARLTDIPRGVSIRPCDRVIGSKELVGREPNCVFEHSCDGKLFGHAATPFFVDNDQTIPEARQQFFVDSIAAAKHSLEALILDGTISEVEDSVFEDIAYLEYSVRLHDQSILDAELFMSAIESRIQGITPPLLFICHASEDKKFVDHLVTELDRRALHAWYDKREILVGDSIVGQINRALGNAQYLIAVLSPMSVAKPWVARELNSTLMRQLAAERITILPVLIADCDIPPLVADLRYADFRQCFDTGLEELMVAIRANCLMAA